MEKKDALLELGIEELPSSYFGDVYSAVSDWVVAARSKMLCFDGIDLYVTPRRIVIAVRGLSDFQEKRRKLVKGPPYDKAFAGGKPTKALEGFLNGKGASIDSVRKMEDGKGKVFAAVEVEEGGAKTADILPEVFSLMVKRLSFPRMMFWNETKVRFPRPVRYIFSIYGSEIVPFSYAGLLASNVTWGHKYISPKRGVIGNTESYFKFLEDNGVVLSEEDRVKIVEESLKSLRGVSFDKFDKDLIKLTARVTESPYMITGEFDKLYLGLPDEVLSTCMKKHQKIFACCDNGGNMLGKFAAFIDGRREDVDIIVKGYENVLISRLKDSRFFIDEDLKVKFRDRVPLLKEIVFIGNLGSLYDKAERVNRLLSEFSDKFMFGAENLSSKEKNVLCDAAFLAKADLTTNLVYEFPELQGIAGREYLMMEGDDSVLANAVSGHYLPKTLQEDISYLVFPDTSSARVSAVLSVIDRIDTLVGVIGMGVDISGSEDPYALRRASGGIVKIVISFNFEFPLFEVIERAYELYKEGSAGNAVVLDKGELILKVRKVFSGRIVNEAYEGADNVVKMILDAVITSGWESVSEVFDRFYFLKALYESDRDKFCKVVKTVERVYNISKKFNPPSDMEVNPDIFEYDAERRLYDEFLRIKDDFSAFAEEREYGKAIDLYVESFFDRLHRFFDDVLVNVDDDKIRNNRLLLMKMISELFCGNIANLFLVHGI